MARVDAASLILGAGVGLPVLAGLGQTLVTAWGHWEAALSHPGLGRALALSLGPGLGATLVAVGATLLILALEPPVLRPLTRLLPGFLALPHAAMALGLTLVLAPSGLIARGLAPLMGWQAPPDLASVQDSLGLSLTLGLIVKETPFLLFVALAARGAGLRRMGLVAATLGHGRVMRFALVEWPALYGALRLPVLAVLAYGMTTVDMGMILGPTLPPPLSVEVSQTAGRADLAAQGLSAALALLQLALTALALGLWRGIEVLGRALALRLINRGARGLGLDAPLGILAQLAALGLIALPLTALGALAVQSLAPRWPFPDLIPPVLTLRAYEQTLPQLWPLAGQSLALALASAGIALALVIAALQAGRSHPALAAILWVPLILPQVAFLPGLARALIPLDLPPFVAVLIGHLVFGLPYVWLVLAGPFRGWNARLGQVAGSLGAGKARILWRLRLPMLAAPLAAALAVGLAASVGQYLATLLLSGGRIATLTTEALALASGPDRARIAVLALAQGVLPVLGFALAALVARRPCGPPPL